MHFQPMQEPPAQEGEASLDSCHSPFLDVSRLPLVGVRTESQARLTNPKRLGHVANPQLWEGQRLSKARAQGVGEGPYQQGVCSR